MRESARNIHFHSHIAAVYALTRLAHRVDRLDVERRVQIGSAGKAELSALYIECGLDEWIDEIESVRPLVAAQLSLERKLWLLARVRRSESHVEGPSELDVRFRR